MLFFGPPPGRVMRSEGARPKLRSRQRLLGRSSVTEKARGHCERDGQRPWPDPAPLRLQAPRLPGQGLRRCFSNSDSSSKNSNQQVCGGVQGRLEVAASRSAASALILPPPPLPPGTLPASNLTLGREPRGCDPPNRQERDCSPRVPETLTIQNGRDAPPALGLLDPPPFASASGQSLLELESKRAEPAPRPCLLRVTMRDDSREAESRLAFTFCWEFLSQQRKQPHLGLQ